MFESARGASRSTRPWLVSSAAHGLLVCALIFRPSASEPTRQSPRALAELTHVVWEPEPGPRGGGGGGGDGSQVPPRQAQLPGRDKVTVPVAHKTTQAEEIRPEPVQSLEIPAQTLAASDLAISGVLEEAPPTTSRGNGDGPGAGAGKGPGVGPGDGDGLGPGQERGTGGKIYRPGSDVTLPSAIYRAQPHYTNAAIRARIEGVVLVECVVEPSGLCSRLRLVKSLDSTFGLDEQALRAATEWRFRPGTRLGEPVPIVVTIELGFTIH